MYYYEVKALVQDEEGKIKTQSFITKQSSYDLAGAVIDVLSERVTNVSEKNFVDVFIDTTKDFFYEIKIEWLDIEGKIVKETYIQQSDSTKEAESTLLSKLTSTPEIIGTKKTNYKEFI